MKLITKNRIGKGIGSFFSLGAGAGTAYGLMALAGLSLAAAAGTGAAVAVVLIGLVFFAAWKIFKHYSKPATDVAEDSHTIPTAPAADSSATPAPTVVEGQSATDSGATPAPTVVAESEPAKGAAQATTLKDQYKNTVDLSKTSVAASSGGPAAVIVVSRFNGGTAHLFNRRINNDLFDDTFEDNLTPDAPAPALTPTAIANKEPNAKGNVKKKKEWKGLFRKNKNGNTTSGVPTPPTATTPPEAANAV